MIIEVDLASVPPNVQLLNAEDVTSFKLVTRGEHAFVQRDTLISLAGEHGSSPQWRADLDQMFSYAASQGWANDEGAIRAHIENRS